MTAGLLRSALALIGTIALAGCGGPLAPVLEFLPVSLAYGGLDVDVELARPFADRGDHVLKMDVFRPAGSVPPTPAVILVHGGFWLFGDPSGMDDWAADLAGQGYAAMSVDYRLLQEGGAYPEAVKDVLAAVGHVRRHAGELNVDPERIALFGVSAGAHLALLAGMAEDASIFDSAWPIGESAAVRAIVDVYGPTDFTVDPATAEPWQYLLVRAFLGADQDADPDQWREASPISYARPDGPAVLILHGTADPIVPLSQAQTLRDALDAAGQRYQYIEILGASHFWGSAWPSPVPQSQRSGILSFLAENL